MKYSVNIKATIDVALDIEIDTEDSVTYEQVASLAYMALDTHIRDSVELRPAYLVDTTPCSAYVEEIVDGAPGRSRDVDGDMISYWF